MITSPKNSRIKEAAKLHRKRYRERHGLVLLEGIRLIQDALHSGIQPQIIFFAPEQTDNNHQARALLEALMNAGTEMIACTPNALTPLTETITPQGMVAVIEPPPFRLATNPSLLLILDQVRDPGNVGTLLRSAEAAGVEQVLLAPNTVDPYNDKVLRAGMGAHFRLPLYPCESWDQLVDEYSSICIEQPALYVADASSDLPYNEVNWLQPTALVVGGEANGASDQALNDAMPIQIPMHGQTESLNAAIAGSIILFEAMRQRRAVPGKRHKGSNTS